jgi:hypothetical protein
LSQIYDVPPRRYQPGREDVTGIVVLVTCAVLAFCWYVAVSRLHLRNSQCLEIFIDFAVLFFGGGLLIGQLAGKRRKREENWPHPPLFVPSLADAKIANEASRDAGTLLGYTSRSERTITSS